MWPHSPHIAPVFSMLSLLSPCQIHFLNVRPFFLFGAIPDLPFLLHLNLNPQVLSMFLRIISLHLLPNLILCDSWSTTLAFLSVPWDLCCSLCLWSASLPVIQVYCLIEFPVASTVINSTLDLSSSLLFLAFFCSSNHCLLLLYLVFSDCSTSDSCFFLSCFLSPGSGILTFACTTLPGTQKQLKYLLIEFIATNFYMSTWQSH